MLPSAFAARRSNAKSHSTYPRTVANRNSEYRKEGRELALHRDKVAFRVAKSRALKKLHASKAFQKLSAVQQEAAEQEAIVPLRNKYSERRQLHELQWIGEPRDSDGAESMMLNAVTLNSPRPLIPEVRDSPPREEEEEEDEGEWSTSSESDESDESNVFGNLVKRFPSVGEDFKEVVNRYSEGWCQKLNVFEKKATETQAEWLEYVGAQHGGK